MIRKHLFLSMYQTIKSFILLLHKLYSGYLSLRIAKHQPLNITESKRFR
jgi:hypothetical protein